MHITSKNFKTGIVKLRVTDPDDLWYLSHIIEPKDIVTGKTTRKVKIGDSENAKVTKKTLTLKIQAETVEFGAAGITLRINGKITESTDDIPKDAYHAISLEEGSEFTIQKSNWLSFQKQKLEEATEQKTTYLLCLFDREEVLFAITKKKGYEILTTIKGEVAKKSKTTEVRKDFHQEILKVLEEYNNRYTPQNIIIASPAFYKEDLLKKIKNANVKKKVVLATCSSIDESALDEVMKRPELKDVLKSSRARQEKMLVDELLAEINKDNLAVYGMNETLSAVDAGAVTKLLVTDSFIKQKRKVGEYTFVDEKMKTVDASQGEIHIVSSEQESGKKLDGLGGIAALLRYKI
jgi:protein pelota